MQKDPSGNSLTSVDFKELISSIPELKNSTTKIDHVSLKKVIDSSNMNKNYWVEIAEIIEQNYNKADGFVVLHGSDTMAYSASALSFMLEGLNKSVIFTGSQIPIGARRTDAKENLITSIEIAASDNVREVCIYFEDKLFRGNRTVKINSQQFEAFNSPNYPALADIGVSIKYNTNYLRKNTKSKLSVHKDLSEDIAVLRLFPSIKKDVVDAIIHSANNIVMESFGSGNATNQEWFISKLENALNNGKIIVNCSQCLAGNVKHGQYETSSDLDHIGIISAQDMTTESAIVKLMYLSGTIESLEKRKFLFTKNLRGEISS